MNNILQHLERFHGHLGPYAIVGYKMGELANHHLGSNPFEKKATVWTGTTPPLSCIIDGIQFSSGCTLGKGNITVQPDNTAKALFTNKAGKQLTITLKPEIIQEIESTVTKENMHEYSQEFYKKTAKELFTMQKP